MDTSIHNTHTKNDIKSLNTAFIFINYYWSAGKPITVGENVTIQEKKQKMVAANTV